MNPQQHQANKKQQHRDLEDLLKAMKELMKKTQK